MGTLQSWRKAYGAIKDSTTVSLAKVNSEFKDLDIAVVKATSHVERPPKERHIRKLLAATSSSRPRTDVSYCVHTLARRLAKTHNWVVALKTLIVIHKILREGDPTFREDLLNYSHKGHVLQIINFKDDSSPQAWDCSAWVRTYALFLEERLECFRVLKYDIEAERLSKPTEGSSKGHIRTRHLSCEDLLEQLPALQQLLFRLVGCQPEGAAFGNYLVQYALALVIKESFKIYCAINDGVINLVDIFFDMSRLDAIKALDIYKRAGQLAKSLSDFYEFCTGLELARNFQFPVLREPPASFLTTMEEYIREAPRTGSVSKKAIEYQKSNSVTREEESSPLPSVESINEPTIEDENSTLVEPEEQPQPTATVEVAALIATTDDLLGLHEINPVVAELEESNALALAITPSGGSSKAASNGGFFGGATDSSGWELALVSSASNDNNQLTESKLAGGFDKLLLDSLYDDAARRQQTTAPYGGPAAANPFEPGDPFAMSNSVAPPTNVQMSMMAQQQHDMMATAAAMNATPHPYHQPNYPRRHPQAVAPANPFGDPFTGFPPPQSGAPPPLQDTSSLI